MMSFMYPSIPHNKFPKRERNTRNVWMKDGFPCCLVSPLPKKALVFVVEFPGKESNFKPTRIPNTALPPRPFYLLPSYSSFSSPSNAVSLFLIATSFHFISCPISS